MTWRVGCLCRALTVTVNGTGKSELSQEPGDAIPHFNVCGPYWTSRLGSCVRRQIMDNGGYVDKVSPLSQTTVSDHKHCKHSQEIGGALLQ